MRTPHSDEVLTKDRLRAREQAIRTAACIAYFKVKNDSKLRRALNQRTRVMGPEIDIGAHVYMYRKPKSQKHWEWFGPGVVIGKEGGNYWTSFGGRCHLVAPEHMRLATGEEIGMAFSAKVAQEDLHKLLELDFIAEDTYVQADETIEDGEGDVELITGEADDPEDIDDALFRESRLREGPQEPLPVAKRFRRKAPQGTQDPDAAAEGLREGSQEVFMMKVPKTE